MQKQYDYSQAKDAVSNFLHDFCKQKIAIAEQYDPSYVRLWQEIDIYMQGGGKRIRAYLALLTYQAYGGKEATSILPAVAAWELLHSCLLVHDDIIDRDIVRHGKLNIAGSYREVYRNSIDADHFADGAAILAGDLLMSSAYELVFMADITPYHREQMVQLLGKAIFGVAGGELMDMEIVMTEVAAADALKIAQYKTAEYTCEYPILSGARLAGAGVSEDEKIKKFSRALGIGFQLVDDLLGVFGDETTTGKSSSSDIKEKKRTVLLQETYGRLDGTEKQQLIAIMDKTIELRPSEVETVRSLMEKSGAKEEVLRKVQGLKKDALQTIEEMNIEETYRAEYRALVGRLLDREA